VGKGKHGPTILLALGCIVYGVLIGNHFGWNLLPGGDMELLADGIHCILGALVVVVFVMIEKSR
jgi:hypothetical protein